MIELRKDIIRSVYQPLRVYPLFFVLLLISDLIKFFEVCHVYCVCLWGVFFVCAYNLLCSIVLVIYPNAHPTPTCLLCACVSLCVFVPVYVCVSVCVCVCVCACVCVSVYCVLCS